MAQLKRAGGAAVGEARRELEQAQGEYREMLTIALAALGDEPAVIEASDLMLHSKRAPVRVCAAWELRALADKRTVEYFKRALHDPYQRQDGSCVPIGDGMVYPVRVFATDGLVQLGMPLEEVRKLAAGGP